MKNIVIILICTAVPFIPINSYSAVTSVGEINVAGETKGIVPASSTVPLIVTLIIDRSLAEPGEEIKTVEIEMPSGFTTESAHFKSILRDRRQIAAQPKAAAGNVLRIELAEAIIDFQNSIYEIAFDCRTSNTVKTEAVFKVRLRNRQDIPIGEFIRPGQADGKLNNDDFTLQVIPNVPPSPIIGFSAEADTTGENDVTLRWQKSTDPDVNGYLIYRDGAPPLNVGDPAATTFRDVNVTPGEHTYRIAAYKTLFLQSEHSRTQIVDVSADTAAPEPPRMLNVSISSEGIEISWKPSSSRDITEYRLLFRSAETTGLEPIPNGTQQRNADDETMEYKFVDQRTLAIGSFTYAVIAIDEADNMSAPLERKLRIFDKPYPNPFTPLSSNADFNRIVFPARTLEDVSGEFTVHIYDIQGMLVKTLKAPPGETELSWDGRDETSEIVESGIYVYQLQVGESFKTGTFILTK